MLQQFFSSVHICTFVQWELIFTRLFCLVNKAKISMLCKKPAIQQLAICVPQCLEQWPRFLFLSSNFSSQPLNETGIYQLKINTVNRKRFAGLNFRVFRGFRSTVKVFCEYKHLSLIVPNNEHLWPRQRESISVKTSMVLKP